MFFLTSIPPKLYNKGSGEIKLSKEHLRMVEANSNIPVDEMQVPWSNQAVNNSSKMVGMMQKSAFGGFYYDMNMENSVRWQERQVSPGTILNKYLAQVCDYFFYLN